MKKYVLLLFFAPWAMAQEVTMSLNALCDSTNSYFRSAAACPCKVSNKRPGANTSDTATDLILTLTGPACSTGVLHACIDLRDDPDITRENCVANSGMVSKATSTNPGEGDVTLSSLALSAPLTWHSFDAFFVPTGEYANRPEHSSTGGEAPDFTCNIACPIPCQHLCSAVTSRDTSAG